MKKPFFLWASPLLFLFFLSPAAGENSVPYTIKTGGHLNLLAASSGGARSLSVSQVGLMAYGTVGEGFRYLGEVGSENLYVYDPDEGDGDEGDIVLNRLYGEYAFSEHLRVKAGQFLTPVGIYNPAYIGALRWTSVTPFVAEGVFPKVIAGVDLNGRAGSELEWEYDLFYHFSGEHDQNPNAVRAKEFAGGEVRYALAGEGRVALPFGRFRSDSSMEVCRFAGVNFLFPAGKGWASGELLVKRGWWDEPHWEHKHWWDERAWYLQYVRPLAPGHYAVVRYGENKRTETGWYDESNIVAGYVYRPGRTLSLKAEYRYHRRETVNGDEGMHGGYFSAGFLF